MIEVERHGARDDAGQLYLEPDVLESEPESDEDERSDGLFSAHFVQTTGVRFYIDTCRENGVVPVQQFISMLDQNVLSLKHRGVGAAGGRAIFECLRRNKHIQSLDMEDNQLGLGKHGCGADGGAGGADGGAGGADGGVGGADGGDGGADGGAGGADGGVGGADGGVGGADGATALQAICNCLRENEKLTHLDLSYNHLAARGCAELASSLISNASLVELSLRGNGAGDATANALAAVARAHDATAWTIAKLDLSDNRIGASGGGALGDLLTVAESLTQLDLSWNALRGAGCRKLMEGLRSSRIVRLNVAWNGIGDLGATEIGRALARCRTSP